MTADDLPPCDRCGCAETFIKEVPPDNVFGPLTFLVCPDCGLHMKPDGSRF